MTRIAEDRVVSSIEGSRPREHPELLAWIRLVVACIARGYLVFALSLAACALVPVMFGLSGSVVLSGSMMPLIHVGDVVMVQPLAPDVATPLGRVVTFAAPSDSADPALVLHRVVAVAADGSLITAGDANAQPDTAHLDRESVIGLARILVPWVGLPALWLHGGSVLPLLIWVLFTAAAIVVEALGRRYDRRSRRGPPLRWLLHAAAAPVGLILVLVTVVGVVSGSSIGQADASFTAQTASLGNSWSTAVAAPAVRLSFRANPSNSTGGTAFAGQPIVVFQDAQGHTTTRGGQVTLTITNPVGATLSCSANPVASSSGLSAFSGCAIDRVGSYTLTARSGSLSPAVSTTFVISRGAPIRLQFSASPTATTANTTFATTPTVMIVDAGGNTVSSTASVAVSLTAAQGATLSCAANPRNASAGQASFPGCRVSLPGSYTLTARSTGLTAGISAAFAITGPAVPLLSCTDQVWMATFSWSPTPYAPTEYRLYVNGIQIPATGADGWNSYVQLTSANVPASAFPAGTATLEVRKLVNGVEVVVGDGTVHLGIASNRTYTCS